ncbi:MAG: hypothetical protein QNJ40_15960 [Xanthomonadales bacterium]|nr:hypothetical protein [Xanthomonadales bacterium]
MNWLETGHPVAVVIQPYHDLGLALMTELSRRGVRLVIVDSDLGAGEAACHRLAWQGGTAAFRYLSPDQRDGELALRQDLEAVYGRVDRLISFFPGANNPTVWIKLEAAVAGEIIDRHVGHRLRLMQALSPLLENSPEARLIHISLGSEPRAEAAVAGLWDRLLHKHWTRSGIRTFSLTTRTGNMPPGSLPGSSILEDLQRLVDLVNWQSREPAYA